MIARSVARWWWIALPAGAGILGGLLVIVCLILRGGFLPPNEAELRDAAEGTVCTYLERPRPLTDIETEQITRLEDRLWRVNGSVQLPGIVRWKWTVVLWQDDGRLRPLTADIGSDHHACKALAEYNRARRGKAP